MLNDYYTILIIIKIGKLQLIETNVVPFTNSHKNCYIKVSLA